MAGRRLLTIDLLKGQGIPTRSNPEKIALMAMTVIIPTFMSIAMFGYYWKNNVLISIQKQKIENIQKNIVKLAAAQSLLDKSEKEKKFRNDCLSEVSKSISKEYLWTPAIVEIVKLLPDSVLLTSLEIKVNNMKKMIPSKTGGAEVEVLIPVKRMRISVAERTPGQGPEIKKFQDNLRSSEFFSPLLESITASQGIASNKDKDAVSYQVECSFKP
jgi:hypothetical protein